MGKTKLTDETIGRNAKIDVYKIIFAVIVALFHLSSKFDYNNELFRRGYIAVEFFFIVSGYLLAQSLGLKKFQISDGKNVFDISARYWFNKYLFFLKYNIVISAVILPMMAYYYGWHLKETVTNIIKFLPHIFLFHMGGYEYISWAIHVWYLSAMLLVFFVLTPILIKYHKIYCNYIAPIVSVFLIGYLNFTYGNLDLLHNKTGMFYSGFLRAFAEISLGCACYAIVKSGVLNKYNKYLIFVVEMGCILSTVVYSQFTLDTALDSVFVYIIAVGITMSFSGLQIKCFDNKVVAFLGKLSFSVYMSHIIVLRLLDIIGLKLTYVRFVSVYLAMILVASLLCMAVVRGIDCIIGKCKSSKLKS